MLRIRISDLRLSVLFLVTLSILIYFSLSIVPRGDEGVFYQDAFNQAYTLFPALDLSPGWTLSSIYLWVVSLVYFVISFVPGVDLTLAGRFISLIGWVLLFVLVSRKGENITWKASIILFNPYVLVYATRAHPLLPSLFLGFLFWETIQTKKWYWPAFLILAVNFQVFIGGVVAMLLPQKVNNLNLRNLKLPFIAGIVAVCGVILTWVTWGGTYPSSFIASDFYRENYSHQTITWGYFPLSMMLGGSVFWFTGNKSITVKQILDRRSILIIILLLLGAIILIFGKPTIGTLESAMGKVLAGRSQNVGYSFIYFILGLGWLRVHRNIFAIFMGILGGAILLSVLPFLYQRLAFFGIFLPCLLWICIEKEENENKSNTLLFISSIIFLILAIFYEFYGVL